MQRYSLSKSETDSSLDIDDAKALFIEKALACKISTKNLEERNPGEFHQMSESEMSEFLKEAKQKLSLSLETVRLSFLEHESIHQISDHVDTDYRSWNFSTNSESTAVPHSEGSFFNEEQHVTVAQCKKFECSKKIDHQTHECKLRKWKQRAQMAEDQIHQLLEILSDQNSTHISELRFWKERTKIAEEAAKRNFKCMQELAEWKEKVQDAERQISQLVQVLSQCEIKFSIEDSPHSSGDDPEHLTVLKINSAEFKRAQAQKRRQWLDCADIERGVLKSTLSACTSAYKTTIPAPQSIRPVAVKRGLVAEQPELREMSPEEAKEAAMQVRDMLVTGYEWFLRTWGTGI